MRIQNVALTLAAPCMQRRCRCTSASSLRCWSHTSWRGEPCTASLPLCRVAIFDYSRAWTSRRSGCSELLTLTADRDCACQELDCRQPSRLCPTSFFIHGLARLHRLPACRVLVFRLLACFRLQHPRPPLNDLKLLLLRHTAVSLLSFSASALAMPNAALTLALLAAASS